MIDESQEVRIPPNPAIDARAAEQDFYRGVVEGYRRAQRRRQLFRELRGTFVAACMTALLLIGLLKLAGWL